MSETINFKELYFNDTDLFFKDDNLTVEKDSFINKPQFKISLSDIYDIYGLGETPGELKRNHTSVIFYNSDNPGHKKRLPMYKHLPIMLFYPKEDRFNKDKYLLWTNSKQRVEIYCKGTNIYLKCDSVDDLNIKILVNRNIKSLYKNFYSIEGSPFKSPLWALGYHQSKYSYYSIQEIVNIVDNFYRLETPLESVWLDIDYMEDYKVFTVDSNRYDKLKNGIKERRIVTILDPAIKIGYDVEIDGTDKDIWIKDEDGENLKIEVWAGESYLPDFSMAKCRDWWSNKVCNFINRYNVSGLWIDMNEPSILNSNSSNPNPKAIQRGDDELGGTCEHKYYHNWYGYLMSIATYEGMNNARPNKRPFILTRSTTIGGHKYAAVWTGDNNSSWEHLHETIRMCLNLSLSGIIFCGVDVGGFLLNCNDELFSRWMGIGAWLPFFRNHTNNFTRVQELWSFSPRTVSISKEAIYRRYKMMRYLYTFIILSSLEGEPFLKPIFWDLDIGDDVTYKYLETSFLIGNLLILCQTNKELNENTNIEIKDYKKITWKNDYPELPIMYLKKGKLIYKNSHIMTTDDLSKDYNLNIIINRDESNYAEEYFYYDEGDGMDNNFWFGKIVYDNGNLSFIKINGSKDIPKFCCQLSFV